MGGGGTGTGGDPVDPEAALEGMLGIAQAALSGMMVHLRPLMIEKIRHVLERNATIVDQRSEALDHLANELFDEIYRLPDEPMA
jgi:hypothetical protein